MPALPLPLYDAAIAEQMLPAVRLDEIVAEDAPYVGDVKFALLDWLRTPDYVETEVTRALADTGLVVRRIERLNTHPVWTIRFSNLKGVEIPVSARRAASWVRGFFRQHRLDVPADSILVIPKGRSVCISFILHWGFALEPPEDVPPDDVD
jgi:hypothetical protein